MVWKHGKLTEQDIEWFKKHIDPHVLTLIIKINRLPFIETTWSCGGHTSLNGPGLYHRGILFLVDEDSEDGRKFIEELRKLIEKDYKFAHLSLPFPNGRLSSHPEYHLEMDWYDYPELAGKDRDEQIRFLGAAFNETYARLSAGLEAFVGGWLVRCGQQIDAAI